MERTLTLFIIIGLLASAERGSAQESSRSYEPGSAPVTAAKAVRRANGLYVRAGLGFAALGNNVIRTRDDANGDDPEGTVTGMGMANELTAGIAVSSSWVLGLGLWSMQVFATDYTPIRGTEIPLDLQRPETLSTAALFADWHFAPQLGVHAQAGLGVSALATKNFDSGFADGSSMAFGPAIVLGLGIDIWGDDSWAIGAMARLNAAATLEEKGGEDYVHGVVTPALVLTVCYNE